MTVKEFRLPDPGEGLTEAEIVGWKVAVGDLVKVNDIVVEIETAKSLVELPVPFAGRVTALLAEPGQTVAVGTPIIAVDIEDTDAGAQAPAAPAPTSREAPPPEPVPDEPAPAEGTIGGTTSTGRTAVLVGYGVKQTEAKRRPRHKDAILRDIARPPGEHIEAPASSRVGGLVAAHAPEIRRDNRTLEEIAAAAAHPPEEVATLSPESTRALASPPVRKYAKDRGVDLTRVPASGGGIVTRADIDAFLASQAPSGMPPAPPAAPAETPSAETPSATSTFAGDAHSTAGRGETRIPIKGVRRMTAQAMVASAFTAPHVTEWITVDVTRTMELIERLKRDREFRDVKVTPLTVLAKAMCLAVRRHPEINASWDEQAQEIVVKGYVNLGIAAATPRGLIVPNVKDADLLGLRELAEAIAELTETARAGRTSPADQSGGTITITNVGVFGVDTGTPILNPGEAAIMALGVVRAQPWVVTDERGADQIAIRQVTNLAMSFDHRLVDGELGSRYLATVASILEDPARALLLA